jgi:DNA-binding HxlR family transcriptional regulator
VRKEPDSTYDSQRRDLLRALADDTHSVLLAELTQGKRTQAQLTAGSGVHASVVSRSLNHLRALGLITSERGRDAIHELLVPGEVLELLESADRLAKSVNDYRGRAQRALAARTVRAARKAGMKPRPRSPSGGQRR